MSNTELQDKSALIPGSIWHYARCLRCGDSFMPTPPQCPCGGAILGINEPAPDANVDEWLMILEAAR